MEPKFTLADITPERISKTEVSFDAMALMFTKLAAHHGDGMGVPDPILAGFSALVELGKIEPNEDESNYSGLQNQLKSSALYRRFLALGELERGGHLENWTRDSQSDDSVMLHPAIIRAACEAKLLFRGEQAHFQPIEFLSIALKHAETNEPFMP